MRHRGASSVPSVFGFHPKHAPKKLLPYFIIQAAALLIVVNLWLSWNGGFLPGFMRSQRSVSPSSVDLVEFFKTSSQGDGIRITWAHAVNDLKYLQDVLASEVHCIEADVVLKNQGTHKQEQLPIMGHPPKVNGDLTLVKFLEQAAGSKKGLKLDFKGLPAVELSLQTLAQWKDKLLQPILLNADILHGPAGSDNPIVPAHAFLSKVISGFPECSLSLGWSTANMYTFDHENAYSWRHVKNMFDVLREHSVTQRLTFPVRASMLPTSVIPLKWLCEQFDASLTVFMSDMNEAVSLQELIYLRQKMPKERVYFDLTSSVAEKLSNKEKENVLITLTDDQKSREENSFRSADWIIKVTNKNSNMLVNEDVVWLMGPDALLASSHRANFGQDINVEGAVTFIPTNKETKQMKTSLQIYLFTSDSFDNHLQGLRCSISATGKMIISSDHLQLDKELYSHTEVGTSANSCYQFQVQVKLISAGDGKCSCKMVVNHEHTNAGNTLHGGMTATMVDSISTMALLTTKPYSPGVSTDLSVSYMRAAKLGEEIAIDAKASKIGNTLAFLTIDITNSKGELIAQGKHTKFVGGPKTDLL